MIGLTFLLAAALAVATIVIGVLVGAFFQLRRRHRACRHALSRVADEKRALEHELSGLRGFRSLVARNG